MPRYQAGLLVLGNSGHGKGSSRIGIIAKRAVRRAPCNVLIVRGEQEGPFQHVVTGIDFSANSEKAARHAVHIAQQDDACLEFVHIVPPVDSLAETLKFSAPLIPLISAAIEKSFNDEIETALYKFVTPIVKRMGGVEQFKVRVRRAHPVRNGILSFLEVTEPDLVVVGAQGKTGLRSIWLGTTAEAIINHSPCSVLTVRPDGFDYTE